MDQCTFLVISGAPFWGSARMGMAILGFLCFINLYTQRANLSVGIVCMLNHTALSSHSGKATNFFLNNTVGQPNQCQAAQQTTTKKTEDGPFDWNKSTQGLLLGAFYWGYLATQLLGGQLAERYRAKYVLLAGMTISTVGTLLCPLVALKGGYQWLIVLRVIIGLGQGVVFPAFTNLWAHWAPPHERSMLVGFTYQGCAMGSILSMPISGALCDGVNWQSVFYFFGALSGGWCVAWLFLGSNSPAANKRISPEEMDYIERSLQGHLKIGRETRKTPWKDILTSGPVWAITVSHLCANFGKILAGTMIPTFMKEVLKFDIKSNGLYSAFPIICYFISGNVATVSADLLRYNYILEVATIRKMFTAIAFVGQAAFLIGTGYLSCDQQVLAIIFLCLANGLGGIQYGGFIVNHADIAPRYAGTLMGISNTFAALDGVVAPYVTSALTPNQTAEEWRIVFWITAAMLLVGSVIYTILGSGDLQDWSFSPPTTRRPTYLVVENEKGEEDVVEIEEELEPLLPEVDMRERFRSYSLKNYTPD